MSGFDFLTTFFLDGAARAAVGDSYDPGFDMDAFKPWCDVVITPLLLGQNSEEIRITQQDPKLLLLFIPIQARLETGVLKIVREPAAAHEIPDAGEYEEQEESIGVPLIAETPELELPEGVHLAYHVAFGEMKIRGGRFRYDNFTFMAPTTATRVDIATVERIDTAPSTRNDVVVRLIPDELAKNAAGETIFYSNGIQVANPIDLGGPIEWVEVSAGPPRLWQQRRIDSGELVGDAVDYMPDVSGDVADAIDVQIAPATSAHVATLGFAFADIGGGAFLPTMGGTPTTDIPITSLPGGVYSSLVGDPDVTPVSRFIPQYPTKKAAIEAAIAEAAAKPSGIVDFEGVNYVTETTVSLAHAGVTLANGGIVPTGQFPALSVAADDVTCQRMKFSRSASAGVLDSLAHRSCVTVTGKRFRSIDCDYLAANQACIYLTHGVCDGAVIQGGSMTGAAGRQNACGVYAAAGTIGNNNITVEGVHIHDTTDGVLLFDTGRSLVKGNRVEHLRKLPNLTLTGWTNVGGNIWRQRTASGTPGVDGPSTDRNDGNTRTITVDGVSFGDISPYGTAPGPNQAGISGGYVYINLAGTDPNTKTVTSGILSAYAYAIYVTGSVGINEHLMCYNRFADNHAEDIDGIGIYFQFANYVGSFGNHAVNNTLKDVCLEGVQLTSLPFAGIGVVGGADTLIMGNTVDGVGSPGKLAPGVDVIPGINGNVPSGKIVATTVRNGLGHGFQVRASGWSLDGCHAHNNGGNGFRVWSNSPGAIVRNVSMCGCHAGNNASAGFIVDGTSSAIGYLSASIAGGSAYNNALWNVVLYAHASNASVRDCAVIGMELRDNGASYPQIHVRGVCQRAVIDDNRVASAAAGAIGLQVEPTAVDTIVGSNQYSLATPEQLLLPVRVAGARAGASWRGSGTPEGVITSPVGATYQRSDGGAGTTLYVKETGAGNTGWVAK